MRQFPVSAEKRLLQAGEEVIAYVEHDEMSPDAAICKVAREMRLPATFLPLLVSGYNIAAAANQRSEPDRVSVLEKLADFPIASIENVQATLYPDVVEPPKMAMHKTAVADVYARPPSLSAIARPRRVKSAAGARPAPAEPTEQELTKKVAAIEVQIRTARMDVEGQVATLANWFRPFRKHAEFPAWEQAAEYQYGAAGAAVAEQVYALANLHMTKTARAADQPVYDPVDPNSLPMLTLGRLMKTAESMLDLANEKLAIEEHLATSRHNREVPSILRDDALGRWQGDVVEPEVKLAGLFGDVLGGAIGGSIADDIRSTAGYKNTPSLVESAKADLQSVPQMRKLQGIQNDFILRDLMHNDEVVQHQQPDEVADAFNELSALAPNAMRQPGIVRAMLRKRLSARVLDPVDIDQLLAMEQRIAKTQAPRSSPGGA